jgi:hypothetical protein
MSNLKSTQYYSDLYDRHTVEECRRWESHSPDIAELKKKHKEKHPDKKVDEKELVRTFEAVTRVSLYFIKGDRYIKKAETIREWMDRDEASDKFFESAIAPEDISCLTCGRLMFVSSKHHHSAGIEGKNRVLFFYDCAQEHMPRRAFYDDGEEFRREKPVCPKCKAEVLEEDKTTDEKWITVITCPSCSYTDTSEIERTINRPDPNFEKDRVRFFLCVKDRQQFISGMGNILGVWA